jgi:hypothetical protein
MCEKKTVHIERGHTINVSLIHIPKPLLDVVWSPEAFTI